jgi:hypothetical protein
MKDLSSNPSTGWRSGTYKEKKSKSYKEIPQVPYNHLHNAYRKWPQSLLIYNFKNHARHGGAHLILALRREGSRNVSSRPACATKQCPAQKHKSKERNKKLFKNQ